jgi:hypothetical protein
MLIRSLCEQSGSALDHLEPFVGSRLPKDVMVYAQYMHSIPFQGGEWCVVLGGKRDTIERLMLKIGIVSTNVEESVVARRVESMRSVLKHNSKGFDFGPGPVGLEHPRVPHLCGVVSSDRETLGIMYIGIR